MWRIGYAMRRNNRLRALPALARDAGASVLVLAAFAAAAALPPVTVPAAALVLLPVVLLTAVAFGRDSAFLAALLAVLVDRASPLGPAQGSSGLLAIAALSGAALAVAALVEELRRSRAETETAHLHSDATARRAAERVEEARRQLREAEARLAKAERLARLADAQQDVVRAAPPPARTTVPDPALDGASRSEGRM